MPFSPAAGATSSTSTSYDSVVDAWFEFALAFWDSKFSSKFDSVDGLIVAKKVWSETFFKHRISHFDVERVVSHVQLTKQAWPLGLSEFLKVCEPDPKEFGYPSCDDIWKQLINPYAYLDWQKVHLFAYLVAHTRDDSLRHAEIVAAARCSPDTKKYQTKRHAVERVYLWFVRAAINGSKFEDKRPASNALIGHSSPEKAARGLAQIERLRNEHQFLKAS